MSINKVIYGNDTLVDLTEDTVAPETLLSGATAHSAAGNQITGTAIPGHTIISSSMLPIGGSALPMAGRGNLQFGSQYDPIFTEDDPTNNKTIVHGQLFICDSESDWNTLSDADFKAKYGADREQVGVYWYLPWANSIAYQTDLTPIGTVLSLAVDTTNTTIFPADLIEFPNKDYVICRGATVKITDYPALYQYFEDEYGDGNYFGTAQTAEGYFVLPNWSADFPTNGVLVIKARVTSDVITFAEVDDEAVTAENVWSAEKVHEYLYIITSRERRNITSEIQADNGAKLIAAIAEQDLAKYGYKIGDYFESPTARTLKQQTNNASTETNVSIKLRYHLADLDTYYGGYINQATIDTHHIAIVVDTGVSRQWHTGDASATGYNGSTLQAFLQGTGSGQAMAAINADIIALFGSNRLLSHNKVFTTALADWAWQNTKYISALTESEISGHTEWSVNGYQEGEAIKPLALFQKFTWTQIFGNNWLWLRNMQAAAAACDASHGGNLYSYSVTRTGRAAGLILLH